MCEPVRCACVSMYDDVRVTLSENGLDWQSFHFRHGHFHLSVYPTSNDHKSTQMNQNKTKTFSVFASNSSSSRFVDFRLIKWRHERCACVSKCESVCSRGREKQARPLTKQVNTHTHTTSNKKKIEQKLVRIGIFCLKQTILCDVCAVGRFDTHDQICCVCLKLTETSFK